MDKISVEVQPDHIESLTRIRKPILGIEELVWNGLDADASRIEISTITNQLNGIERIRVVDDGSGIHRSTWKDAFGHLGGSPKLNMKATPSGRRPHGKSGRGRFKAFGLGSTVLWHSCYREDGKCFEFDIQGRLADIRDFSATDPKPAASTKTGVAVEISEVHKSLPSLSDPAAVAGELARRLALYLRQYPGITIRFNSVAVDPRSLEEHSANYPLDIPLGAGPPLTAELTVIEWKCPTERAVYLCDAAGFAHDEQPPGIQAPGYHFTAYLKSDVVAQLADDNAFVLGELHPTIKALLDSAKTQLRNHFRSREATRASDLVKQWQEEKVYPYTQITNNPIEVAERQVFDVCAVKVHEYSPGFDAADRKSKQLTFRLIREALESNPTSLQAILREVLALPAEQQNELAAILEQTKLAAIINAARVVMGRLAFLSGLDPLLFGQFKRELNEPRQLHRILADEFWLFGEQYAIGVDEESLKNLLKSHVTILGRTALVEDLSDVKDLDGNDRRLDLMLYGSYPQSVQNSYEHLVIELKRPSRVLGKEEIGQIEDYAFTVSKDERFDKERTRWTFVLLGNDLDSFAETKCNVSDRQFGHIHAGRVNIFVKRWSAVLAEAKWRYEFFRQKLEYQVTTADGLAYLRAKHAERLPKDKEGNVTT